MSLLSVVNINILMTNNNINKRTAPNEYGPYHIVMQMHIIDNT